MAEVSLSCAYGHGKRAYATNITTTSFTAAVATVTEPTGDGVITCTGTNAFVLPFGTANNTTFDIRFDGWWEINSLWIPFRLLQWTNTVGLATGVADTAVVVADLWVDTVSAFLGTTRFDYDSPANDTQAWVTFALNGAKKLKPIFDMTGATNGNCVVGFF